jgi:1,2-phenylacetyl-CoA epoxidase catalytic subunit
MKKKYIDDDELFNLMKSMDHKLAHRAYNIINYIPRMKEYSFSETYTKNKIVTLIAENEDFKNRLLEASDIIFFIPKEMLNKDQRKIQNLLRKHL